MYKALRQSGRAIRLLTDLSKELCRSWKIKEDLVAVKRKACGGLLQIRSFSVSSHQRKESGCSSGGIKTSELTATEGTDQITMSQYIVGHDKSKKCFYIKMSEQGAVAVLEYNWVRPGLVDLYHTEVPPEFRGQGVAKILVEAAFDCFCGQDVLIRPTCTYIQKYLRENPLPRYMDHVEKDFL